MLFNLFCRMFCNSIRASLSSVQANLDCFISVLISLFSPSCPFLLFKLHIFSWCQTFVAMLTIIIVINFKCGSKSLLAAIFNISVMSLSNSYHFPLLLAGGHLILFWSAIPSEWVTSAWRSGHHGMPPGLTPLLFYQGFYLYVVSVFLTPGISSRLVVFWGLMDFYISFHIAIST